MMDRRLRGAKTLWGLCDQDDWHVFGTSAKFIAAIEKHDYKPAEQHALSHSKRSCQPDHHSHMNRLSVSYREIKADLLLGSISGGTDIVLFLPLMPHPACISRRAPVRWSGLAIDVVDESGLSVKEKGELVCRQPFPVMPIEFFGDTDGSKYRAAYFERFNGMWAHGDFAEHTDHGGFCIYGRADATLNPGGVRMEQQKFIGRWKRFQGSRVTRFGNQSMMTRHIICCVTRGA